jgi:hypothetical protein
LNNSEAGAEKGRVISEVDENPWSWVGLMLQASRAAKSAEELSEDWRGYWKDDSQDLCKTKHSECEQVIRASKTPSSPDKAIVDSL